MAKSRIAAAGGGEGEGRGFDGTRVDGETAIIKNELAKSGFC